jgi:hypothetical protein
MTAVAMRCVGHGARGPLWDVLLNGERIVSRSVDPEHDAARALLGRGITGPFVTMDDSGRVRMRFADIERAAGQCVVERRAGGLSVGPWKPFSRSAIEPPGDFDGAAGVGALAGRKAA